MPLSHYHPHNIRYCLSHDPSLAITHTFSVHGNIATYHRYAKNTKVEPVHAEGSDLVACLCWGHFVFNLLFMQLWGMPGGVQCLVSCAVVCVHAWCHVDLYLCMCMCAWYCDRLYACMRVCVRVCDFIFMIFMHVCARAYCMLWQYDIVCSLRRQDRKHMFNCRGWKLFTSIWFLAFD